MAELLYRLGKFAARRSWTVVLVWVVILALSVVGFLVGFRGLATGFDIPGTASGEVTDRLKEELPDFAGASGMVVYSTVDGSPFTEEQRAAIRELTESARTLPDVADVNDPFSSEQERADREQQIEDGRAQIADARKQLDDGEAQLDAAQTQLDAASAPLTAAREQAVAAGAPEEQIAAIDAQIAQVQDQRTTLDAQRKTLRESRAELEARTEALEQGRELLSYSEGIRVVSEDESAAIVNVAFTEPRLELSNESKDAVKEHFESHPVQGTQVSFSSEISQGVPQIIGVGEGVGVAIAAVILIVMLGSLLAAALPVFTAILGVVIATLATLSFSSIIQMASVTPFLGVMLGLAVGIDYSLFIVNRHRKQLLQGAAIDESIGLANGTAGNAVVFAGSTVVVALVALNVIGIPFLGLMGTAGAVAVLVAVLIATSLTPALLGLIGIRVLGRRARSRIGEEHHEDLAATPKSTLGALLTVVATSLALLVIAIPALSMRVGLPDGGSEPPESSAHQAFATSEEKFGAGANSPLLVTAMLPEGLDENEVVAAQLDVARVLAHQEDVVAVAPIAVSENRLLAAFQVLPAEGPNSLSTEDLVKDLRSLPPVNGDIPLGVAGQAAVNIDISQNLADILPLYIAVVIGISVIIMIVVFRSLLVPIVATGGFILSLFATYGALTAVFQWGWFADLFGVPSTGPVLSFLPVLLVGILFGLAMDYQLFLASGMREAYVHGAPARLAVVRGFRAGRSVVVAAGLIMVAVFGGFIFSESTLIRSVGFGLAFGVLVDAFLVRMLLMPALMHLLGRSAWWLPRWLDRILPNVDVEGAALERRHHTPTTPEPQLPDERHLLPHSTTQG